VTRLESTKLTSLLSFLSSCQVHPEVGISNKAMNIINNFVYDIFERLAKEVSRFPFRLATSHRLHPVVSRTHLTPSSFSQASVLAKKNAHSTINARDIQTAVRLILPGELYVISLFWFLVTSSLVSSFSPVC